MNKKNYLKCDFCVIKIPINKNPLESPIYDLLYHCKCKKGLWIKGNGEEREFTLHSLMKNGEEVCKFCNNCEFYDKVEDLKATQEDFKLLKKTVSNLTKVSSCGIL